MTFRKHRANLLTILLVTVHIFAGCSQTNPLSHGTASDAEERGEPSQILVVGLAEKPTSLDPADQLCVSSEIVIRNIFDGLVTRDHRSGVHLELAESITATDERTLRIKLREGVLFHDGVELNSEDVVYTFNRIIQDNALEYPQPHTSPRKSLITPLDSIEALDRYTVIMHLHDPWPAAFQLLVHQQIVPRHYLELVGDEVFQRHPIGTGPFKFIAADEEMQKITLGRFPDYYGGAPSLPPIGPACLEEVEFRVIPDHRLRMAALTIGELDLVQSVPLSMLTEIPPDSGLQIRSVPGTRPIWMELNIEKAPFKDLRVRQALNYAVDKDQLIEEIFLGKALALSGPLSPFNDYVSKDLEPYPFDPELAKLLLARSGWIDINGEGLQRPEGDIFELTIDTTAELQPLAQAVADQYRALGIRVSIRIWDSEVIEPLVSAGERQAFLGDWGDPTFDPIGHFDLKWHGRLPGEQYGSANFSGYNDERVNDLILAAEVSADPKERYEFYNEAQHIIYRDAPAVFLLLPQSVEAATAGLLNWAPAADGSINLHDVCLPSP